MISKVIKNNLIDICKKINRAIKTGDILPEIGEVLYSYILSQKDESKASIPVEDKIESSEIINTFATPYTPFDWTIVHEDQICSVPAKPFVWDISRASLYFSEKQRISCMGYSLLKELKWEDVLGANVLDYLLKNTKKIPTIWRWYLVYFWGTIYRGANNSLYVRYLGFTGNRWDWGWHCLDRDWGKDEPALIGSG